MKPIEAIAVLNGKNCKGSVNIKELGSNQGLEFKVSFYFCIVFYRSYLIFLTYY